MAPEKLRELLVLQAIVATLGERVTPAWWRTQFLNEVGLRSLARIFPRTAAAAALNSVVIAAREDHDRRVGVGSRYHLFRLPPSMEDAVSISLSEATFAESLADLVSKTPAQLLAQLGAMARGVKMAPSQGPVKVGSHVTVADEQGIQVLAAHYRSSFDTAHRTVPYFESTEHA